MMALLLAHTRTIGSFQAGAAFWIAISEAQSLKARAANLHLGNVTFAGFVEKEKQKELWHLVEGEMGDGTTLDAMIDGFFSPQATGKSSFSSIQRGWLALVFEVWKAARNGRAAETNRTHS